MGEKTKRINIQVFNKDGAELTGIDEYFIDTEGRLYILTEDIDSPMKELDTNEYHYTLSIDC